MINLLTNAVQSYVECREKGYSATCGYYLDAVICLYIDCQYDNSLTQDEQDTIQQCADLAIQIRQNPEDISLLHDLILVANCNGGDGALYNPVFLHDLITLNPDKKVTVKGN
tara:strand:+ start:2726 stop:3061 length:336 start_codon:yes stop_codon:yes gene_type:complete